MHIYIYDSFLNHRKYNNVLSRIETRITDLGLNGKIIRLNIMKNIKSSVENELKRGAKTIVAVGNDQTINQVISAMAGADELKLSFDNVPFGIIPIGKEKNNISSVLGIPPEEAACDVLSSRRIEKLDLCQANKNYFISNATITSKGTIVEIDKTYSIEIAGEGEINIINFNDNHAAVPTNAKFDPHDGIFELFIKTKKRSGFLKIGSQEIGESIFSLKKLTVFNNHNYPVVLDNSVEVPTPVEISIMKQKMNLIVGKKRNF